YRALWGQPPRVGVELSDRQALQGRHRPGPARTGVPAGGRPGLAARRDRTRALPGFEDGFARITRQARAPTLHGWRLAGVTEACGRHRQRIALFPTYPR